MRGNSLRPLELAFLDEYTGKRLGRYETATWLRSPFPAPVWVCNCGKGEFSIDFNVLLDDGNLLTSPRHEMLLTDLKRWLCLQTHADCTGGVPLSADSAAARISRTLHVIDYFLLHSRQFELASFGMAAITANDINGMLIAISSSRNITTGIYGWKNRLSTYLRSQLRRAEHTALARVIHLHSFLELDLPPAPDRMLDLDDNEILLARAWLWTNGYYRKTSRTTYRFTLKKERIAAALFSNTLRGRINMMVPEELLLCPVDRYTKEFPAARVRSPVDDTQGEKLFDSYIAIIRRLGLLRQEKASIPLTSLAALDNEELKRSLKLKPCGRFRTLPMAVVFMTLRHAIEFCLEFGDELVNAYLALLAEANCRGLSCATYSSVNAIDAFLSPNLKRFGVRTWSIDPHQKRRLKAYSRPKGRRYFEALRSNAGLWELLKILFGAVQICVGILSPRRSGELNDLRPRQCLDAGRTRLLFYNRKSGIHDLREQEARPVPPIVATLITQLERLHAGVESVGLSVEGTNLFCHPRQNKNGLISKCDHSRRDATVDLFCDYFETPLDDDGGRYYIRQHQLRRFFAMLFFWGDSMGGTDTLRWALAQTDVEHVYRYVSDVTPGEVLRSVKAQFSVEKVKEADSSAAELRALLAKKYRTTEFGMLDEQELELYVEELMMDGRVVIEPEFFDGPNGRSYRILIVVTKT